MEKEVVGNGERTAIKSDGVYEIWHLKKDQEIMD
jgi:hypothetical protein